MKLERLSSGAAVTSAALASGSSGHDVRPRTRRGRCAEAGAGWGDALDKQGAPSSGDALPGPASDIWGTPGSFLLPSLAAIAEMRPRSSRGLWGAHTPGAGRGPPGLTAQGCNPRLPLGLLGPGDPAGHRRPRSALVGPGETYFQQPRCWWAFRPKQTYPLKPQPCPSRTVCLLHCPGQCSGPKGPLPLLPGATRKCPGLRRTEGLPPDCHRRGLGSATFLSTGKRQFSEVRQNPHGRGHTSSEPGRPKSKAEPCSQAAPGRVRGSGKWVSACVLMWGVSADRAF